MSSPSNPCVGSGPADPHEEATTVYVYAPVCAATDDYTELEEAVAHFRKEGKEEDEVRSVMHEVNEVPVDTSDAGESGEDVSVVDTLDVDSDSGGTREVVSVVKAQESFQPGSTPMERTKRYLSYNLVGVIEATDLNTHHVINVEFNNQSIRMAYHFRDEFRYDLASLGPRGAVYACQPTASYAAHVVYKPYVGAWASHSDWKYQLRRGTSVVGVAAGGSPATESLRKEADIENLGNVVIATSEGELIFLSGAGVERGCITLPGTFVTMAAGNEWVFLVTRDGSTTTDGSQNLIGRLVQFDDFCILQNDNLPVPRHHTLKWVGITEEGAPAIYDSSGALSVMPRFQIRRSAMWMRILHTSQIDPGMGRRRSYWPVGIMGDVFFCLILPGEKSHPGFPRPVLQELSIRLPFKQVNSPQALLEERVICETLLLHILRDGVRDEKSAQELSERELALDKAIIRLIKQACQSDSQGRALDLARLLNGITSFDIAIKLASLAGLTTLQRAIEGLKVKHRGSVAPEPYITKRPSEPALMNGVRSEASSSQKRPAESNISSGDSTSKRRVICEPALPAMVVNNTAPIQSRGNPFLQKPRKKSKTNPSALRSDTTQGSLKEWIRKDKRVTGR